MKKTVIKISKYLLRFLVGFIAFLIVYFISVCVLSWITVNKDQPVGKDVTVYILSNGVHAELVVPVKNQYKDWTGQLRVQSTIAKDTTLDYAGIGWGDKGFYMDTKTWAELKPSTAFKALFWLSSTAMHVTFHKNLHESELCKQFTVSKESYLKLVYYIEDSFKKDKDGTYMLIANHSYGKDDSFYEAKGTYSLFKTCNTWTNEALKQSGLKACVWTPFDKGLLYQYSK